jgi:hypothetical protein
VRGLVHQDREAELAAADHRDRDEHRHDVRRDRDEDEGGGDEPQSIRTEPHARTSLTASSSCRSAGDSLLPRHATASAMRTSTGARARHDAELAHEAGPAGAPGAVVAAHRLDQRGALDRGDQRLRKERVEHELADAPSPSRNDSAIASATDSARAASARRAGARFAIARAQRRGVHSVRARRRSRDRGRDAGDDDVGSPSAPRRSRTRRRRRRGCPADAERGRQHAEGEEAERARRAAVDRPEYADPAPSHVRTSVSAPRQRGSAVRSRSRPRPADTPRARRARRARPRADGRARRACRSRRRRRGVRRRPARAPASRPGGASPGDRGSGSSPSAARGADITVPDSQKQYL